MMSNSEPFSYWLHAQCISFLPLLVEKGSLAAPMACHLVAQVQALLQYMTQRHQHAHIYSKDNFHQCVPTIFLCKFRSQTSHPYCHQCLDHSSPCGNNLLLPGNEQLCATILNVMTLHFNGLQTWPKNAQIKAKRYPIVDLLKFIHKVNQFSSCIGTGLDECLFFIVYLQTLYTYL